MVDWNSSSDWDNSTSQIGVAHPSSVISHSLQIVEVSPPEYFTDAGLGLPSNAVGGEAGHYDSTSNTTFITYQTRDFKPVVCTYDHERGYFSSPRIADTSSGRGFDATHEQPAMTMGASGNIFLFWGAHNTDLVITRGNNARKLNSFTSSTKTGWLATYPHPFLNGTDLVVTFREREEVGVDTGAQVVRVEPEATWEAGTWPKDTIIDFAPTITGNRSDIYAYTVLKNGDDLHYAFCHLDSPSGTDDFRYNVYYCIYNLSTQALRDINGTALTKPLSKADADANSFVRVVHTQADSKEANEPRAIFDSSGNLHIIYNYDENGAGAWDIMHVYWNGSAWTTPVKLVDTTGKFSGGRLILRSDGDIDAYLRTSNGVDLWRWASATSTWSSIQTAFLSETTYPTVRAGGFVTNANDDLFIFCSTHGGIDDTVADEKIFGIARDGSIVSGNDSHKSGFWLMDETSGTTLEDTTKVTGTGATLNGSFTLNEPGMLGGRSIKGPSTQSSSNYVDINTDLVYRSMRFDNEGFTLAGWVYPTNLTVVNQLTGGRAAAGFDGFTFRIDGATAGDPLSVIIWDGSITDETINSSASGITTNAWQHVAMTFKHSDKNLRFYVGGSLVSSHTATLNMRTHNKRNDLYLASLNNQDTGNTPHLIGRMDGWGIWSRVLTAAELSTLAGVKSAGSFISSKKTL